MTYDIAIKEILKTVVTIEANSEEEAIEKATEMYQNGEIVLDYSHLDDSELEID